MCLIIDSNSVVRDIICVIIRICYICMYGAYVHAYIDGVTMNLRMCHGSCVSQIYNCHVHITSSFKSVYCAPSRLITKVHHMYIVYYIVHLVTEI